MNTKRILLAVLSTSLFITTTFSQNHQVLEKQYFPSEPITGLIVDGTFSVEYITGENSSITVIGDIKTTPKVKVETIVSKTEGTTFTKISGPECKLIIEGMKGDLKQIQLNGTTSFETKNAMETEKLVISTTGASSANIDGTFRFVVVESSGASKIMLTGTALNIVATASGVSEINISTMEYQEAKINSSGISHILVKQEADNQIISKGISIVEKKNKGEQDVTETITEDNIIIKTAEGDDDTFVNIIEKKITIKDKDGNTESITIGPFDIDIKKNKAVTFLNKRKSKFDGHWGGIELGINGYNTPDYNMDFPKKYEYMDLTFPKSMAFYLNLFEHNISFSKNQQWGMLSGLGFEWHNYRFSNDVWLDTQDNTLQGFYFNGDKVKKTKLMVSYITVPVIFEFQTNNKSRTNSFHVGVGVVGGLRIGSHTKAKFESRNSTYYLVNPNIYYFDIPEYEKFTTSSKIIKNRNDFNLNPVKLDATFRIGWSHINLFATYSLTPMFREKRGPELYPWAIGITLLGW